MPRPTKEERAASRLITKRVFEEEDEEEKGDFAGASETVLNFLKNPAFLQQFFGGEGEGGFEGEGEGEGEGDTMWSHLQKLFSLGEGEGEGGEGEIDDSPFSFSFGADPITAPSAPFSFDFASAFGSDNTSDKPKNPDDVDDDVTSATSNKSTTKGDELSPLEKKKQGLDYYAIFGIKQTDPTTVITKAYKRLSLQHHPDRHMGDKKQEKEFAFLSRIYQTLIDPRKRQFYDKHGDSDGTDLSDGFLDAYEHWKQTFPEITPDDTEAYKAKYLDSEEEKTDVINAFNKCKGDLYLMMKDELFFSSPDTYTRDYNMVKDLIAEKRITNEKFIANFNKNAEKAKEKLITHSAKEQEEYKKLEALALEIATKKAKKGSKPSEADIQKELSVLIMKKNRDVAPDEGVLENIALQLAETTGVKDDKSQPLKRKRTSLAEETDSKSTTKKSKANNKK